MYSDISIDLIDRHPGQPRKHFDEDLLTELATSIRRMGLLEPLLVRPVDDRFVIVAGERRWRACKEAGVTQVTCRVLDLNERDAYVLSVAENVNRADMTVLEETEAFAQLMAYGKTIPDIAGLFGKTEVYITIRLSFRSLVDEAKALLDRGDMGTWLARYLADLRPGNQRTVLNRFSRGEFRNETEAAEFAAALRDSELQEGFFAMEEPTEEDREIRRAKSAASRRDLDELERLSVLLAEFAAAEPGDLVDVLGDELAARAAQIERVTERAIAAKAKFRKARARANAMTLGIRAELEA